MEKNIILAGVGGQGILSIAFVIDNAALAAGHHFKQAEVHGMAQRGGDVSSTVIIGPTNSALIGRGEADVAVGLEPLEIMRALPLISAKTKVLLSNDRVIPFALASRGIAYPPLAEITDQIRKFTDQIYEIDTSSLIKQIGSFQSLNFIMLGALTGLGVLPFEERFLWKTLQSRLSPEFMALNQKAFTLGQAAIRG